MTKQVRQSITPTHILGSTGTVEGSDLGFRDLASFAGDVGPLIATTQAVRSDASDTGVVTTSHTRAVVSSSASAASAVRSAVVASINSEASGITSAVAGSADSTASGAVSAVIASTFSVSTSGRCAVMASRRTQNNLNDSLAMGDAASGPASTANRKIHLFGSNGNVSIAGTLTQNATFTDFAELMPNGTGEEIPPGTLLTLDGGAVRPADEGEDICGVVSHTAAVLAGDTPFCWQGRYLTDEWGRRIYEEIPDADWRPGEGQTEADRPMQTVLKENPEWNPSLPQVPRSDRPDEWTPVGLIGQVFVRTGEQVQAGDSIGAVGGLGYVTSELTGLRVMTVTKDYDGSYGIARCLLNVQV